MRITESRLRHLIREEIEQQLILEGKISDIANKFISGALKHGAKFLGKTVKGVPGFAFIGKKLASGGKLTIKDIGDSLNLLKQAKNLFDDVYDEKNKSIDTDVVVDKLGKAAYDKLTVLFAFGGGIPGIAAQTVFKLILSKYLNALGSKLKKDVSQLRDMAKEKTQEVEDTSDGWSGVMVTDAEPDTDTDDSQGWSGEMVTESTINEIAGIYSHEHVKITRGQLRRIIHEEIMGDDLDTALRSLYEDTGEDTGDVTDDTGDDYDADLRDIDTHYYLGDAVKDAIAAKLTKYARGSPEIKKIAALPGIDSKLLDKRLNKIHELIEDVPTNNDTVAGCGPGDRSCEAASVRTFKNNKPIKDVVKTSLWRIRWDTSMSAGMPFGEGIYFNMKFKWGDEEEFYNQHGMSRQNVIRHEFEHVVTRAIEKVMGVNRDDPVVQGDIISRISAGSDGKWEHDTMEIGPELREFGDWLSKRGGDVIGSTRAKQFTPESIKSLAFFSLIHHQARGHITSQGRYRVSDNNIKKWTKAARSEWPAALGDPDDLGNYTWDSDGTGGPLWQMWLEEDDSSIPVHHQMLPQIKNTLIPDLGIGTNLEDLVNSLNSLAVSDSAAPQTPTT